MVKRPSSKCLILLLLALSGSAHAAMPSPAPQMPSGKTVDSAPQTAPAEPTAELPFWKKPWVKAEEKIKATLFPWASGPRAPKREAAAVTPIPSDVQFELRTQDGTRKIWGVWPGGEAQVGEVLTLPEGTPYFHWLAYKDYLILKAQGGFDRPLFDEVYEASKHTRENQGPGFYVSLSPTDSATFGDKVLMGKTKEDFSLAMVRDASVHGVSISQDQPGTNDRLRKLGIHGLIPNADTTWINFIRHEPVARLEEATPDDLWRAVAQRNAAIAAKQKSALQAGNPPVASGVKPSSELGLSDRGFESPILASQIFAMKGYGEAVPNAQTQKYLPEWDRLFRGLPMSAEDEAKIDAILLPKSLSGIIVSALFWKDDPALANLLKYLKRKQEAYSPELNAAVDELIKREAAYDAAETAYFTSPEYKAYETGLAAYMQSPEYTNYSTARGNYTNTPEYKAYQDATAKFQATPEYIAYADVLKKWQKSPEYLAYLQSLMNVQNSPAFRSWQNKLMNVRGFNEPPPMPPEPAGRPTPPAGAPEAPPEPVEPPGKPAEPLRPDALKVKPDPTELSEDGQKLYVLRKLANEYQAHTLETPLRPPAIRPLTPEEQKEVELKKLSGCARRFVGL